MPEVLKSQMKEGLRIIIRASGPHDGKQAVVLSDKATKGVFPVRLADGSTVEIHRTSMQMDESAPEQELNKNALKKGRRSMKFCLIDSNVDKHARSALAKDIESMGGEVVESEAEDVYSIWCGGGEELISAKTQQPLYRRDLILDAARKGEFPDPFEYQLRVKPGTEKPVLGSRASFTKAEDKNMLDWIEKQHFKSPGIGLTGNRIWQEAERIKVTGRTWQSMRERFKSALMPAFEKRMQERRQNAPSKVAEDVEGIDDDDDVEVHKKTETPVRKTRTATEAKLHDEVDLVTPAKKVARTPIKHEIREEEHAKLTAVKRASRENRALGGTAVEEEDWSLMVEEEDIGAPMPDEKSRKGLVDSELDRLEKETGYSKAVVVHACIVCNGDVEVAEEYLQGRLRADERKELWNYEDDKIIILNDEGDLYDLFESHEPTAAELRRLVSQDFSLLVSRRGMEKVRERYLWIHASRE